MENFLKEIAEIRLGYQFRGKIQYDKNSQYKVILMKDITPNNSIDFQHLAKTNIEKGLNDSFFIKKGDILFLSKGSNSKAIYIPYDLINTIATSHFYIIRIKNINKIIPKYLSWYLNQRPVQKYISKNLYGTALKHINRETVDDIKITIPNILVQQKIAEIVKLNQKENELINKIQSLKNKVITNSLLKKITFYPKEKLNARS